MTPEYADWEYDDYVGPYWIEDPSHSWLVVSIAILQQFNLMPSSYSYLSPMRGLAYLEEDVDAPALLNQLNETHATAGVGRHIDNFDDYVRRHGLVRFPA